MARSTRKRPSSCTKQTLQYAQCEDRQMLAVVSVGELNSGVAVSDDATGEGFIMYSETDVHDRFHGISADNSDHFVAVRLDGLQWQYNNDTQWLDFESELRDSLVAQVNFGSDYVQNYARQNVIEGIWFRHQRSLTDITTDIDFRVVPNQFDGQFNEGEFSILGSDFEIADFEPILLSEFQLGRLAVAMATYENSNGQFPGLANFDTDGNPLLSWRVHILPQLGLYDLYEQFRLDEPWDSTHNLPLADQMPRIFKSPNFGSINRTPFLAIAGDNTKFELDGTPAEWNYNSDNLTASHVEVDASKAVVWTSPSDWYFDETDPLAGLGDASDDGFAVSILGGRSFTLTSDVDPDAFAEFVDDTDGLPLDYQSLGIELTAEESLRQISGGLETYSYAYQGISPSIRADDGTPLLSWRVSILPFIGYGELYSQFRLDEPWDSPHNIALLPEMPEHFYHPSVEDGKTIYLGLDGPGTLFESTNTIVSNNSLIDGYLNTISIVEADPTEAVEWTRPLDLAFDPTDPLRGLGSLNGDGRFNAAVREYGSAYSFATDQPDKIPAWATYNAQDISEYSVLPEDHWKAPMAAKLSWLMNAANNHESAHQEFPNTIYDTESGPGTPLLSWRVRILPFIEQNALYNQFNLDEPWDSPHNLSLLPLMPSIFRTAGVDNGMTVIQGAHGSNTFFRDSNDPSSHLDFNNNWDVIAMLEVSPDNAIQWTKPDDFAYDAATIRSFLQNPDATGFHVGLIDGTTRFFDDTIGDDVLNKLVSPADYSNVATDTSILWSSDLPNYYRGNYSMRQLAYGIQNYEWATNRLPHHAIYSEPRGGTPLLSWRVEILPFIGHQDLYDQFRLDEPWDSEHNLSLLPNMPRVFRHPGVENGKTVFQVITSSWELGQERQSLFPLTNLVDTGFGDVQDGSSNTVMLVEANLDQAVEWTRPADIVYDPASPTAGFNQSEYRQGNWFVTLDGWARVLAPNFRSEMFAAAVSPNGGDYLDFEDDNNYYYGTIDPIQVCYQEGISVTESNGSTLVSESGSTDSYQIVLDSVPDANVTITIDPGLELDVGGGMGAPITLVFTPTNALTPQVVRVSALDDSYAEPIHFGQILHTATSTDASYYGMPVDNVEVLITDNDQLPDGAPLLNEIYVDSDSATSNREFVEIISEPSTPLTDVWLIAVDGDGSDAGVISFAQDLSSVTAGSNGLTLLGVNYVASNPWSSETDSDTAVANLDSGAFDGGSITYFLVESFSGLIGVDMDTNNNGAPDKFFWARGLDSFGWSDGDTEDRVYSAARLVQSGIPEAASRTFADDFTDSFASWFNGEIPGGGSNVDYGSGSSNLPAGARITPGADNVGATAPSLTSDGISLGDDQRSSISELSVTFDGAVEFDADAFSVIRRANQDDGTPDTSVPITVSSSVSGGMTIVTITFDGLTRPNTGSLVDGNYQLTVHGDRVRRTGTELSLGSDFVFGNTADETFYSLYGDNNGDRKVNIFDLLSLRQTYRSNAGGENFQAGLDYDENGTINVFDLLRFRQNYNKELPFE